MSPAQQEGWEILLDLGVDPTIGKWCLIGGQMVWLLAHEHHARPPRTTEDMDVVVDVRADQKSLQRLCRWLEDHDVILDGITPDGVGHRFARPARSGPGRVVFDVLAPDNLGVRADRTTMPPARTVSVPGGRAALDDTEAVTVALAGRIGTVNRPSLLAAILAKASATEISARTNPERDWTDTAFLLTLIPDPMSAAEDLGRNGRNRKRLRKVATLLDPDHPAWRTVGDRAELGQTALAFLLDA